MRDWTPSAGDNHIFAGFIGVSKEGGGLMGRWGGLVKTVIFSAVCFFSL